MFQFHEDYPIFVRSLKRREILLANVHRRGSCVLKEHDTRECKGIRDMSQRQGHAGKYQEFLRPGMFQDLSRISDAEQTKHKEKNPCLL
jgi:hypothetical protein